MPGLSHVLGLGSLGCHALVKRQISNQSVWCLQAFQDVPEFLEAAAEAAIGTNYGPAGGRFASKDYRQVRQVPVHSSTTS